MAKDKEEKVVDAVEIPRLSSNVEVECIACGGVIDKAPFYYDIEDAGPTCASCKEEMDLEV